MTKSINKKSNLLIALVVILFLVIGAICLTYSSKVSSDSNDESKSQTQDLPKENPVETEIKDSDATEINDSTTSHEIKPSDDKTTDNTSLNDMNIKVKEYILNGQNDKSDAEKLKWSNKFLDEVDFKTMYDNYLANGGVVDDVQGFATYITLYSPIPTNWQNMFKQDLYDTYGKEIVRLEYLEDVLYKAYINIDGKEVPYVIVSARTGYYHG